MEYCYFPNQLTIEFVNINSKQFLLILEVMRQDNVPCWCNGSMLAFHAGDFGSNPKLGIFSFKKPFIRQAENQTLADLVAQKAVH